MLSPPSHHVKLDEIVSESATVISTENAKDQFSRKMQQQHIPFGPSESVNKTNVILCQSCFSSTCWICNEQVPFYWAICFLCCQQKQTTAAAAAPWKSNADDALAFLRVKGHQNVLLSHAVHHDTLTHRNVAERVCAVTFSQHAFSCLISNLEPKLNLNDS